MKKTTTIWIIGIILLVGVFVVARVFLRVSLFADNDVSRAYTPECLGATPAEDLSIRDTCWYQPLAVAYRKGGLKQAVQLYGDLFEKSINFAGFCHWSAHYMGDLAYTSYMQNGHIALPEENDFRGPSRVCATLLYHSFVGRMVEKAATIDIGFAQASAFCDDLNLRVKSGEGTEKQIPQCYIGIGNGLTLYYLRHGENIEKSAEKAARMCEQLPSDHLDTKRYCGQGIFDAITMSFWGTEKIENVSFQKFYEEPYWLCETPGVRQFKQQCYEYLKSAVWEVVKGDLRKAGKLLEKVEETEIAEAAMWSFALSASPSIVTGTRTYESVVADCVSLQERLRGACVAGIVWNQVRLTDWSKNKDAIMQFCNNTAFSETVRKRCIDEIFVSAKENLDDERKKVICNDVENNVGSHPVACDT